MQNLRTVINYKPLSHFGSFSNKCPKGKKMPLKSDTITYLFSFNGKEKIDEINGVGNDIDFGARVYDTRLGRWLSCDPLESSYPFVSTYSFAMNKPIMFVDIDGRKILPTYTFLYSTYGNIYLNIMNNLTIMPVANIYLRKFIGPDSERDLLLSFSNLALTNDRSKSGPGTKAVSGEKSIGRNSVTMFNSMGIFEPTSKIDLRDGTQAGKYISEFYMVAVVFHELIVHSSKLEGVGDRSFANNSKVMNDIKECLLEYSKLKGDKLTGEEAAALAYMGAADADIDTKSAFFQANFKGKDLNYIKQVQDRVKYMKAPLDMTKGDREAYKAIGDMEYQESEEIKPE
jgi:RHS repeat-associated protein